MMNGIDIRVETSVDGRELTLTAEIENQQYAFVYVYMHGSSGTYRAQQVQRLHRALLRLPANARIYVGGDWNFVLELAGWLMPRAPDQTGRACVIVPGSKRGAVKRVCCSRIWVI